tara:strand:+ start:1550 stop:1963 length:414 start_codon:yes stop_codon:yes gene_type:complete
MIKSINVVFAKNDDSPKGLNNVNPEELNAITNNYVQHIDCLDLDKFTMSDRHKVFVACIHKLCINGTMQLKFINLDLLANKIDKGEMTGQQYSKLLPSFNSCWSHLESMDVISQSNLSIANCFYDNIYTIIKLEKTS